MILRYLVFFLTLSVTWSSALAATRELTVYSDGSLIELEGTAKKGVVELTLPAQIKEGTLRVKPLENGTIGLVELLPARFPDKLQKELDALTEQKSRLQDRMKALEHREGIFAAAAKSQSSKAPRKSKTNPDPLASVRQGTDFAIAQLESVYTARRKTEQELKRVEARLMSLSKKGSAGPTVRVVVSPATARIRIAAILKIGSWSPRYEIRLKGTGIANLTMLADITDIPEGYTVRVVPAALSAAPPMQSYPLPSSGSPRLAEWPLPVEKEQISSGPLSVFSFTIKNNSGILLPAGQASVYSTGEYLGTLHFPAVPANTSITLTGP